MIFLEGSSRQDLVAEVRGVLLFACWWQSWWNFSCMCSLVFLAAWELTQSTRSSSEYFHRTVLTQSLLIKSRYFVLLFNIFASFLSFLSCHNLCFFVSVLKICFGRGGKVSENVFNTRFLLTWSYRLLLGKGRHKMSNCGFTKLASVAVSK